MPENKGRVLYVGGFELPDRNAAAHRVLNNAKILKMLGYDVVFCGVDNEITAFSNTPNDVFGFESYPLPYPKSTKQWVKQMCDISAYTEILEKYPDIKFIFAYNLHALPLARLLRLAKKKGIRLISDCTEWYGHKFSIQPTKFIKWLDTLLCMCGYHKKCDGMIAISNYLRDYYQKHIKSIIVLPPLVDLSDEKYSGEKRENKTTTLVYSGSPAASKEALGEVVKCLNKFKNLNFKLRVVGVTRERFVEIYGIEPNDQKIDFLGRVSHIEALTEVKKADYSVIIRPRTRVTMAGFPTKFAEAISCGTAVIANDTSDLSSYLRDNKNGYIVSLEDLEKDLYEIISSGEKPLVENDTFDYKNWVLNFEEFINNL